MIPRELTIGGVAFPIVIGAGGRVAIASTAPGVSTLSLFVSTLVGQRPAAARSTELRARQRVALGQFDATPLPAGDTSADWDDARACWRELSGRELDTADAYGVTSPVLPHSLAIPRDTLIALVDRLGAFHDEAEAGTVEVDDDMLRALEQQATELDALDARACPPGAEPYGNLETARPVHVARRLLLPALDGSRVLGDDRTRARLHALGLATLVGYAAAAVALAAYHASSERARLVGTPPPARAIEAMVSLDWFRVPTRYVPPGVAADGWLALCEATFARDRPRANAGIRYTNLERAMHQLRYRVEAGTLPSLYAALPT